jgi:hypothetical protein
MPFIFLLEINHQDSPLVWRTFAEGEVTLSEGGAVASKTVECGYTLTTTGIELTAGKHYWEVELLSEGEDMDSALIGISRPNLDPAGEYFRRECTDGWFTCDNGCLWGNGRANDNPAGKYKKGDRVGVLLDLDSGSLRFFKNGVQHGPGYAAGSVTGSVVAAVQMYNRTESVRLLPNAEAPANA